EVMGIDVDLGAALEKSFLATLGALPTGGGALCSIADADKPEALPVLAQLSRLGFTIYATEGTAATLRDAGISAVASASSATAGPTSSTSSRTAGCRW